MIFRRPFFRRFVRGAAFASILGVIVCPQVSCMVPQTIDAIGVESPHPAPHIVLETIPSYLLARVLTLLEECADRLQIVILTCHPERYRGLESAAFLDLKALCG